MIDLKELLEDDEKIFVLFLEESRGHPTSCGFCSIEREVGKAE